MPTLGAFLRDMAVALGKLSNLEGFLIQVTQDVLLLFNLDIVLVYR
jgi:C4-type Zn-finger protein